jgi:3-methyladenine DNA glycosylase AlkC
MNIILENIRKVLLENRVDDVKKKYPEVDPAIIDYFVKEDPSGNNKYLDWLVKAMTHGPTIQSVEDILDEAMQ